MRYRTSKPSDICPLDMPPATHQTGIRHAHTLSQRGNRPRAQLQPWQPCRTRRLRCTHVPKQTCGGPASAAPRLMLGRTVPREAWAITSGHTAQPRACNTNHHWNKWGAQVVLLGSAQQDDSTAYGGHASPTLPVLDVPPLKVALAPSGESGTWHRVWVSLVAKPSNLEPRMSHHKAATG
jgi:hypothetical protein